MPTGSERCHGNSVVQFLQQYSVELTTVRCIHLINDAVTHPPTSLHFVLGLTVALFSSYDTVVNFICSVDWWVRHPCDQSANYPLMTSCCVDDVMESSTYILVTKFVLYGAHGHQLDSIHRIDDIPLRSSRQILMSVCIIAANVTILSILGLFRPPSRPIACQWAISVMCYAEFKFYRIYL